MTGLVGWWPLHENYGNTAHDLSGNENHGTLNGGIVQGVAGKGGLTSYSFGGGGDRVEVTDNADIKPNSISLSAWINPSQLGSNYREVIDKMDEASDNAGFRWISNQNNKFSMQISDGANSAVINTPTMSTNEWHHLCMTFNKTKNELRGYFDGSLINSKTAYFQNVNENLKIGTREKNGSYDLSYFGLVNDVRMYNRPLSPQEIQKLYDWGNGDFARPLNDSNSSSAVSRWAFDGDATDSWGNNGGTVNGATFVSNDVIRGEALDFNSSNNDYVGLGNDSSLNPGNIAISAWVNSDDVSLSGGIVTRWGTGTDWSYILRTYNGNFRFQARDANDNSAVIDKNATNDEYYHLAMTYDSNLVRTYINGSLVGKDGSLNTSLKSSTKTTVIGNADRNGDYNRPFDGKIDDVRIYNKALSPSEVFELYRWGTRGRDMRKQLVNQR